MLERKPHENFNCYENHNNMLHCVNADMNFVIIDCIVGKPHCFSYQSTLINVHFV